MKLVINTDGGARGNPGPGAIGIVVRDTGGKALYKSGKYIGVSTNNDAEYTALITALKIAKEMGASVLECRLDSELAVKQLNGLYKVKNERIKKYVSEIRKIEGTLDTVIYKHIPREQNKDADLLVNEALDRHRDLPG